MMSGGDIPSRCEVCVLVPTDGGDHFWLDRRWRETLAGQRFEVEWARHELGEYLGHGLDVHPAGSTLDGADLDPFVHRSVTSVALATALEQAGLRWRVLDPGIRPLRDWSGIIRSLRANPPAVVGISTTFLSSGSWLRMLCHIVRRELPSAKVILGGYYYMTSKDGFLSADADVYLVGPGELRIGKTVQAMLGRGALERIPGLYIRRDRETLDYTGDATDPDLTTLPLPSWDLSDRIEPPVDRSAHPILYAVETQRGCRFRCEFCTYRELADLSLLDVERSVEAILDPGTAGRGGIFLADATATHPKDRWARLLEALIERGGSTIPIRCYARVNDVNDRVASLMKQAGISSVFIGQESGDQRVLNLMRKGTRVDRVPGAVRALGRHGLDAHMGFIFGFPGETQESAAATRRLMLSLNDGFEHRPVVMTVDMQVFRAQEGATVFDSAGLGGIDYQFGYGGRAPMSPEAAWEELLTTCLEASHLPHAPSTGLAGFDRALVVSPLDASSRDLLFRWRKTMERGVALFVMSARKGSKPSRHELRAVREELNALAPGRSALRRRLHRRLAHRARKWAIALLAREWKREHDDRQVGPLTRGLLAWEAGRTTRRLDDVVAVLATGRFTERIGNLGTRIHCDHGSDAAADRVALRVVA